MQGWPLSQGSSTLGSWDEIIVGGKDGLFVVVVSLSWWILKRAEGEDEDEDGNSQLGEAVQDVRWVLENLASVLAAEDHGLQTPSGRCSPSSAENGCPSPSCSGSESPTKSKRRRDHPTKTGPPNKRRR